MARLLRDLDYLRLIQADNLSQIIESNQQVRLDIEQSAQAEMKSYLAQRYKVNEVFSDTTVFDLTTIYRAKNLVEYTETAYATSGTAYSVGDRVLQAGYIYENTTAITAPAGAFDSSKWTQICADKALFFVTLPEAEHDLVTEYAIGDKVWYNNRVYTAISANTNILPTDSTIWGLGVDYYVTGQYPDNTDFWTAGDNRNQQIVLFLIDIVLYHLHSRINPRNIPDLRKERYNGNSPTDSGGAIGWLKSVAHGNVQADLPVYSPAQGLSMRYGSAGTYDSPSPNMLW